MRWRCIYIRRKNGGKMSRVAQIHQTVAAAANLTEGGSGQLRVIDQTVINSFVIPMRQA
jgi:hypothetical protein